LTEQTWLILGASSSIAKAFAHEVAQRGAILLLAGRDLEELALDAADLGLRHGVRAEALLFEARNFDSHRALAALCREKAPGVLNVLLAFGVLPPQTAIEGDFELARTTMETNLLGAISVMHHLIPLLERQGSGHVIGLGSVAGERGRLRNYVYGASKAGLHVYLEGLGARLAPAGVTVTLIKPGFVDTAMTWGTRRSSLMASPEAAARSCLRSAQRRASLAYVPWYWRYIMLVIRNLPARVLRRLNI
jgi:decaprenylphospho-beta-D-erythro-pentofuranosid-2-ulose 2-reductase